MAGQHLAIGALLPVAEVLVSLLVGTEKYWEKETVWLQKGTCAENSAYSSSQPQSLVFSVLTGAFGNKSVENWACPVQCPYWLDRVVPLLNSFSSTCR